MTVDPPPPPHPTRLRLLSPLVRPSNQYDTTFFSRVSLLCMQMGAAFGREGRRDDRVRSDSMLTFGNVGFGIGGMGGVGSGDPHRESELTVATENLTLEEIDGNVFRMSKDQVCTWGIRFGSGGAIDGIYGSCLNLAEARCIRPPPLLVFTRLLMSLFSSRSGAGCSSLSSTRATRPSWPRSAARLSRTLRT